jgi:site-specific DNA recombinase
MDAIGYIRVSTEGQAVEGVSLDAQKAKITAWADLNGYELGMIYVDAGISGKRADNRPGLQDALQAIKRGDALVVYSLSRLARSTRDTLDIADILEKKNADMVSIQEHIDTTTAAGKMVFRMLAVLNEFERDQIAERTRSALQYKKSKGEKTGGTVPYGFDVQDGILIKKSSEQKAIRLMMELRRKGYSFRAICKELEKDGCKTKTGGDTWNPKTIRAILKRAA